MVRAATALDEVYREVTGEPPGPIEVHGNDPQLPGRFLVGTAAAASVGATTLAAAELLRERGGDPGRVAVDTRHAAVAFRSERYLLVDGEPPGDVWAALSGDYRAADGWVKLHCNYPHHARAAAAALGVREDRDAVAAAIATRKAVDVEDAVHAAGGVAAAMRSAAEWAEHPAGRAVRTIPLVATDRIADAPARVLPPAERPLAGVRVLDLTHVIAGPLCGRVLAAHGADVLHVGAAHLPTVRPLVVDMNLGKRSTHIDLRTEAGRATLRSLVREADVLVASYRPGALAGLGFGPGDLAGLRPGIVVVSLSAYGHAGPWRERRGFDSLVQMASGVADEGARTAGSGTPRPLPAQALDHATGWLAAAGVITALRRRMREGGSWYLRPALARTGVWLDGLGRLPADVADAPDPGRDDVADLLDRTPSGFGELTHVRVPGTLTGAPPHWNHGTHLPGTDPAEW